MASVNKVFLLGNVGKDPEIKYMGSGDAVLNFSIATSESWKDKTTGEKQEKTEWHRVTAFGKSAEILAQYTYKGSKLYVEGRLVNREFQTKDGETKSVTEIRVVDFMLLGDKRNANGAQQAPARAAVPANESATEDVPF